MSMLIEKSTISYEGASLLIETAVAKAREMGVAVSVFVLDDGASIKASVRMDGAPLSSIEAARRKAATAVGVGISSRAFFEFISTSQELLYSVPNLPDVATLGGGQPLQAGDAVVGAVGVSGASPDQDDEIAYAAKVAVEG
jgi:uncharacterized protein GlcG (DUF336 family)